MLIFSHVYSHLDQILCWVVKGTRAHQKLHLIALGENYSRFKEGLVDDGCEQNVENLSGKKIKITFDDLDIENHASCDYDYVMVKVKEK